LERSVQPDSVCYASHAIGQREGSRGVQIRISNLTPTTRRDGRLSSPAMERTEFIVGEGVKRHRALRVSRHRPEGESRQVHDDRMLWTKTALMHFAYYTTINSVISNAAELRLHSRHVVGVAIENLTPMTRRDVAPEHPILNELCEHSPGCTHRTPPARWPQWRSQRRISKSTATMRGDGRVSSPAMERTDLMVGEGANSLRAGRL
jgi:hypothetical protein